LSDIPEDDEFVIQKYVATPLLWKGKKFHFRAYTLLRADGGAYLYENAFILSAGLNYDMEAITPNPNPNPSHGPSPD